MKPPSGQAAWVTTGHFKQKLNRPLASCPGKKNVSPYTEKQARDKNDSILSIIQSSYGFSTSFFSANRSPCRRFKQSQQFHYVSAAKFNNVKGPREASHMLHPIAFPSRGRQRTWLPRNWIHSNCLEHKSCFVDINRALLRTHKEDREPLEFLVTLLRAKSNLPEMNENVCNMAQEATLSVWKLIRP